MIRVILAIGLIGLALGCSGQGQPERGCRCVDKDYAKNGCLCPADCLCKPGDKCTSKCRCGEECNPGGCCH